MIRNNSASLVINRQQTHSPNQLTIAGIGIASRKKRLKGPNDSASLAEAAGGSRADSLRRLMWRTNSCYAVG